MNVGIASEITKHDIREGFTDGETNHAAKREEGLDGLFTNGEGYAAGSSTVVFSDDGHVCDRQVERSTALACE